MGKRHKSIGIKQIIRIEWVQKASSLMLAGLDAKSIRHELHSFLADRKGSGSEGERGSTSRTQVVNILMRTWVSPDAELKPFRDASLAFLQKCPSMSTPIHWGMISAAYPFWFNVARQTGRLLFLQDQITQAQVFARLKEQYGDRETVARYARATVRSFVAWGILKDSEAKGCYEKSCPTDVGNNELSILLLEASLLATPEGKCAMSVAINNPALFPFQLPAISGSLVAGMNSRLSVVRYGLDDELICLKER